MDVAAGFGGFFSFYYHNAGPGGAVNLYSGLHGSGGMVGTFLLPTTTPGFFPAGQFQGVPFKSAVFTGSANTLVFDNITLGGGLVIPEPSSITLVFTVLAALGIVGRKRILERATY